MRVHRLFKNGLVTGIILGLLMGLLLLGASLHTRGQIADLAIEALAIVQAERDELQEENDYINEELNAYKNSSNGTESGAMINPLWITVCNIANGSVYLDIGGEILKYDYLEINHIDIEWED